MKKLIALIIFVMLASPIFAADTLNITSSINGTDTNVNTRTNFTVFNLTVYADNVSVTISGINITLNGNANGSAISKVFVFNSSITGTLLGTNSSVHSSLVEGSQINVTFTSPFLMGRNTRTGILVLFEISSTAQSGSTIGGNMTTVGDLVTNHTVLANVALPNSSLAVIRDVHANVSITPRFVDTGVENQSFVYVLNVTGTDSINKTTVNLPAGFTLINITGLYVNNLELGGGYTINAITNQMNISLTTPATQSIRINFTANTNATPVTGQFTSTIAGSNISSATTYADNITVITQPLLNISNVAMIKSVAIVNGTDYWEFNFTINYTGTVPIGGIIQFKMSNWTSGSDTLSIYNSNCPGSRCLTLRNESNYNTTGRFNVTNDYESVSKGIPISSMIPSTTQSTLFTVVLRMVIPTGTPISSAWQATYGFLFRSSP
jgi:hypothetical protein